MGAFAPTQEITFLNANSFWEEKRQKFAPFEVTNDYERKVKVYGAGALLSSINFELSNT